MYPSERNASLLRFTNRTLSNCVINCASESPTKTIHVTSILLKVNWKMVVIPSLIMRQDEACETI